MRPPPAFCVPLFFVLGSAATAWGILGGTGDVVYLNLSMVELSRVSIPHPAAAGVLQVSIDVPAGVEVNFTQNTLAWNPDDLSLSACRVNEALDKSLFDDYRPRGCIEGADCSEFEGIMSAEHVIPIADGAVLYTCDVEVSAEVATPVLSGERILTIQCLDSNSGTTHGKPLTTICNDTLVTIMPTPTHSPTEVPTVVPTATRPAYTETPVPRTPTQTATATVQPHRRIDDDGCQVSARGRPSLVWALILAGLSVLNASHLSSTSRHARLANKRLQADAARRRG
jgi:hypothetical protein